MLRLRCRLGTLGATLLCLLVMLPLAGTAQSGKVSVLYAGSLTSLMEKSLGPAFTHATDVGYEGEGNGSVAAARMMQSGLRRPDVFISADPWVDQNLLMGPQHPLIDCYLSFAAGALVLAFNPRGPHAADFQAARAAHKAWFDVLATPGLRLGRTDPNLDPLGYRTIFMFGLAEQHYHRSGLTHLLGDQIFPETELMLRLDTGQIDCAVLYRHQAVAHAVPYISLPPQIDQSDARLAALYRKQSYITNKNNRVEGAPIMFTVAIMRDAPNPAAAQQFVRFLLSQQARPLLSQSGLQPSQVLVAGDAARLPADLRAQVRGRLQL